MADHSPKQDAGVAAADSKLVQMGGILEKLKTMIGGARKRLRKSRRSRKVGGRRRRKKSRRSRRKSKRSRRNRRRKSKRRSSRRSRSRSRRRRRR